MDSVRTVFGSPNRTNPLYLGSLKGNIGHSETAAGVASLLKVLAMFQNRGIPPLRGFQRLNHTIPPLEPDKMIIPTTLIRWDIGSGPRISCIYSYGASGSNSAVICSEWVENGLVTRLDTIREFPILLSAASSGSLHRYIDSLVAHVSKSIATVRRDVTLQNLSFTLSQRRKHHRVRWSTTASTLTELLAQLRNCKPHEFVQTLNPKAAKRTVLVFSGQSRTTIGVPAGILAGLPQFSYHIQRCNDILKSLGCPDILPALTQASPIDDPTILQCSTVAVQYACAQCWIDGGLEPDAIVGHSLGELTALAISGVLSLTDTLKVVYTRAQLIKTQWGPDPGVMMAIHADIQTVRSIMDEVETRSSNPDDTLEIACYNSLTSHVIVGKAISIAVAEDIIQQDPRYRGIRHQRLDVSHGFHSRFTEPLLTHLALL
ncbi:hypothetical protein MFIFM68171_03415 [Madurella fahalii]|uniref:Ketosynthase family 3 (KS3) domain-containing protein n=1 Tax=Madurella fahalii TaxID=1157608 RepID=A0ABQ0G630_9PEZI